jgi:mRNA interferase MazF
VVISSPPYHRERADLIIMAITSQVRPHSSFGDVHIGDWKGAGLVKPSIINPVIATIEHTLIVRHLGRLDQKTQEALRKTIHDVIG